VRSATITITGSKVGAVSNEYGDYSLALPEGLRGSPITITARRIGYAPVSRAVRLSDDTLWVDFELTVNRLRLQSVVTSGVDRRLQIDSLHFVHERQSYRRPDTTTERESLVERPAMAIPGLGGPRYPEELKAAKIEGRVLATFVVDTTGKADLSTFRAGLSTHRLFTEAVKDALPAMRFMPGEVGGRKVRMSIEQTFEFKLER
jgi:TonB family protein